MNSKDRVIEKVLEVCDPKYQFIVLQGEEPERYPEDNADRIVALCITEEEAKDRIAALMFGYGILDLTAYYRPLSYDSEGAHIEWIPLEEIDPNEEIIIKEPEVVRDLVTTEEMISRIVQYADQKYKFIITELYEDELGYVGLAETEEEAKELAEQLTKWYGKFDIKINYELIADVH